MSRLVISHRFAADDLDAGLAALAQPRDDTVHERSVAPPEGIDAELEALEGPFSHYRRTLVVDGRGQPEVTVVERFEFKLAVPIWAPLFVLPFKRSLRRRGETPTQHFWEPPDRLDARAATVLALLCTAAMVAGYLGTVITQTITFAAKEFGSSRSDQSTVLAAVRVGVLLSLALVALADRRGRRLMLLWSAALGCITCAFGAAAPSLGILGVTQAVSRGFSTTLVILLTVIAVEEMPAGARAYAVSVMTMTGALGAGMAVWFLPLADHGVRAWRLLYVLPLVYLPLVVYVGRRLPESRRFTAAHAEVPVSGHGRQLRLLATTFFLTSVFSQPASQLQNDFLRTERGFDAARISLFTLLTATPGAIGIVLGGRLADVRGRRIVAAVAVLGGSICTVLSYLSTGWPLWAWAMVGIMLGAAAVPALGVYGPELFPTALRGKANGVIQVVAVLGSGLGLVAAGHMADSWGLGKAMAVLLVAPVAVAGLVLVAYPETAHQELEVINPEDLPPPELPGEHDPIPL